MIGASATAISHLKLYHYPMTRSARVRWLLHEILDDDFEIQRVELYQGEQYGEAFLALNPNHGVPVLEVTPAEGSTFSLYESGAMISWLADVYADRELAPSAAAASAERASYLQMLHFCTSWFDMMLWQIRLERDLTPADKRSDRVISNYMNKIEREVEPQLKERLERDGFGAGKSFTAVDCVLGHNLRWARFYDLCGDEVFSQYLQRLDERPAYRKAFDDVGDFSLKPSGIRE